MGILKSGIVGPFTGKVGPVVGSTWKGKNTLSAVPANHTDANSLDQQAQRMKMKLISSFLTLLKQMVILGFTAFDKKLTPLNNAIRCNIGDAVAGDFPDFSINYEKVILSRGKLRKIFNHEISSDSPGTLTITWTNNTNHDDAFSEDTLHLCIINAETGKPHIPMEKIYRKDEKAIISLPNEWAGKTVIIIGFMVKKEVYIPGNLNEVSGSKVMGRVVLKG